MMLALGVGAVVLLLFSLSAGLAVVHWRKPGLLAFLGMVLLLAVLTIPLAIRWAGLSTGRPIRDVAFVTNTLAGIAFLLFVFEYTGRGPTMTPGRIGVLLGFGALTSLGVLLSPYVDGTALAVLFTINSVLQVTHFAAVGYGTFLVARSTLRYDELPTGDVVVSLCAGSGLVVIILVRVLIPEPSAEPLQWLQLAILAVMGIGMVSAQFRLEAFERGPSAGHLAREAIFDDVRQAAFLTDREDRVLDCNETATAMFGPNRDQLLGRPIGDVLSVADPTDVRSAVDSEDESVVLTTMNGRRRFEIRQSALSSRRGEPIGRAYVLEDVTDRQTHEQRLEVLNRVLRHNLRNDLDALQAFAETLESADDEETAEFARQIRDTATGLAEMGETVRSTERLLARDEPDWHDIDLVALAHRLVDDIEAQYPDAIVRVKADESTTQVIGGRLVFEAALSEVLENALEHNDRDRPHVTVTIESTETTVRIEVSDDGPGIPDRERAVLLDGAETPLRHGSGLGLWFVHWAMIQQGGDLSLRANDPRGTVVSLMLPDRFDRSAPAAD